MRVDDRLLGLILVVFGIAIFLIARTFPLMAGLPYGPGFFPSIAAVGLMVCGVVISVTGALKARTAVGAAPAEPLSADDRPVAAAVKGGVVRPVLIGLIVVFFGLTLQPLGFHISATLTVAAAAFVFGAGPIGGLVLALVAAFGVHAVFYSLLRVPLPWGVLTPVAW
ncbi:MAG: tripartite tricarboxylate transporter TctB family protein [Pseudomonadota bacterium]